MGFDNLVQKPAAPLNWNAAAPELPEMPMVSPGADAMSMTIAGVLPTLAAELTASVTALSVKENMYSGKLTAADSAYANSDDQGGQAVGQLTSMLGEVGKMAQSAGGGSGGGGGGGAGGIFSSLMEQAMKAMEGASGSHDDGAGDPNAQEQDQDKRDAGAQGAGAQGVAGQAAPQGAQGAPAAQGQPSAGQGAAAQHPPSQGSTHAPNHAPAEREPRSDAERHQSPPVDAAGPGEGQRGAGPAPITPQEPAHRSGDDDLSRRM